MAQNIYDDPGFFDGYSALPRSVKGLDGAAEWPVLLTMLPSMADRAVVDLGCGFGWFCRWAADAGASTVLGVDLSENMLARARRDTTDPRISYEQCDLDQLELPAAQFDFAYSSLTLHYLTDLPRLFRTVHQSLRPGAEFVFSAEHPICTAPSNPQFVAGPRGNQCWPVDGYLREGARTTHWLAPGVVKQHRTIATYLTDLLAAGFELTSFVEWGPSAEQIRQVPEWEVELERPYFLLVGARRA
ncbi:MAG: class I SAM-dependent methyltransferase [Actinomycetota bacterium]|nr:class I SAM-dependent methyltransferase [Actinomycetota bacterium]